MLLTTAGLGLEPDDVVKIESQVADGTPRITRTSSRGPATDASR